MRKVEILEGYHKFITYTCSLKKIQQPDDKNKSFQYLKSMIHDALLTAKPKFFEMVSGKLNAFLKGFQTLLKGFQSVDTLKDLLRDFFGRIILKDVPKKEIKSE